MEGGAVEAEEDAVGDGGPGGVLGVAVEAHLVLGLGLEAAEDGGLVGEGVERHGSGGKGREIWLVGVEVELGKWGARRRARELRSIYEEGGGGLTAR